METDIGSNLNCSQNTFSLNSMEREMLVDDEFEPRVVVIGPFFHGKLVNAYFGSRKLGADGVSVFKMSCVHI